MMEPWHVVLTFGGRERAVAELLKPFDGFTPRYLVRNQETPFVTGYVFARWATFDPIVWHEIRNVVGVLGFIGKPWPIEVVDPIVDRWAEQVAAHGVISLEDEQLSVLRGFSAGDLVKLTFEPFVDRVGVCVWADDRGARIKIGLLGREHDVYVPIEDLTPVNAAPDWISEHKRRHRRRQARSAWSRRTRMVEVS